MRWLLHYIWGRWIHERFLVKHTGVGTKTNICTNWKVVYFQILCNGPGTCVPICYAGLLLKVSCHKEIMLVSLHSAMYTQTLVIIHPPVRIVSPLPAFSSSYFLFMLFFIKCDQNCGVFPPRILFLFNHQTLKSTPTSRPLKEVEWNMLL